MNPAISIIVPIYNAEKTIQRSVESVLNQTHSSFELILIDDGSTDNSGKRCDDYSGIDGRIKVIHQENKGVSEARNAGVARASGQYVFFLDVDDELYPETLEKYIELVRSYDADVLLGSLEVVCETGKSIIGFKNECGYEKNIWEDFCFDSRPFGYVIGKMYKSDIIRGIQFNKNMISQEDLDYNLEVYNRCRSIVATPVAGYIYHYSSSQRAPQVFDYIKNQLKLYDYSEMNYQISKKAKKAVLERIAVLAYTALYNTTSKDEYDCLANIIGGTHTLGKHSGEFKNLKVKHAGFMEQIIRNHFKSNYVYLRARKKIAELMRSLKQ